MGLQVHQDGVTILANSSGLTAWERDLRLPTSITISNREGNLFLIEL